MAVRLCSLLVAALLYCPPVFIAAQERSFAQEVSGTEKIRATYRTNARQIAPTLHKDIAALQKAIAELKPGANPEDPAYRKTMSRFMNLYRNALPALLAGTAKHELAYARDFFGGGFLMPADNQPADAAVFQAILDRLSAKPGVFKALTLTDSGNMAFNKGGEIIIISNDYLECDVNEQAAVLAHELAHLQKRHFFAAMAVKEINAALSGNFTDPRFETLGKAAELHYQRQTEYEADATAVTLMSKAGYDVKGLEALLKRIDKGEQPDPRRNHPTAKQRLAALTKSSAN